MIKRFFAWIFNHLDGDDSLISAEGWQILEDDEKRAKLRLIIDNYYLTGIWDFSSLQISENSENKNP